jgi:fibronectin type 3 domain-containing protein
LTITSDSSTNPTLHVPLSGTGHAQAYQFSLTWDAPQGSSHPIVGYKIYRSTSGNAQYQLLNPSVIAQTNFTDSAVQSGMTYQYYVTAVDSSGAQSSPSNITEVTIP